jgi:two-component system, NtrC family, response regulator AtoC
MVNNKPQKMVENKSTMVNHRPMKILLTWSDRSATSTLRALRRPEDTGPVLRFLSQPESLAQYQQAIVLAGSTNSEAAQNLVEDMSHYVPSVELCPLHLEDPSDYAALFLQLVPLVTELSQNVSQKGWEIDVLLSAGTPQAQTIWVILVQSGLLPARMFQVIPAAFVPIPHPRAIREINFEIEGFPEIKSLRDEVTRLRAEVKVLHSRLLGSSEPMRVLRERLSRVAASDLPVIIQGETGTGKELIARTIHESSSRAKGPFIAESCGALAEGILAAELFGHEAGSFTGATQRRRGLFEQAHGGTLFLDEIGEMPLQVQAMLLRVLQEGMVRRVGGEKWFKVEVRVITATHRDLRAMMKAGTFREDLYYRLQGASLLAPPLRERGSDIPLLIDAFWREAKGQRVRSPKISPRVMRALYQYSWPGNVRQLRAEVNRWAVFAGEVIDLGDLSDEVRQLVPPSKSEAPKAQTLDEAVAIAERAVIEEALVLHQNNLLRTAKTLDIERNTLKRKLLQFGLYPPKKI